MRDIFSFTKIFACGLLLASPAMAQSQTAAIPKLNKPQTTIAASPIKSKQQSNLSNAGHDQQRKLESTADGKLKARGTTSNVVKKTSDTQSNITGNMK